MGGVFSWTRRSHFLIFSTFLTIRTSKILSSLEMSVSALQALSRLVKLQIKPRQTSQLLFTGLTPSTLFPVSYNLTYVCPDGQVFDHDWFATPGILLTCQVKLHPLVFFSYVRQECTHSRYPRYYVESLETETQLFWNHGLIDETGTFSIVVTISRLRPKLSFV